MSSRTENDDPWPRHSLRTADRGPRQLLPTAGWLASMMPDLKYGSGKKPGSGKEPSGSSEPGQAPQMPRESDGWRILSYMLGGMILYGGIGWLVGKWTGISVLFPVGMILGIALSIVLIVFRVTKT